MNSCEKTVKESETQDKDKEGTREIYTNLGNIYKAKGILMVFIAIITIIVSKDIKSLALSAGIYYVSFTFDLCIVSNENNGPRKNNIRFALRNLWCVSLIFVMISLIYALELTNRYEMVFKNVNSVVMIGFGIISPLVEFIFNKPKND